MTDTDKLKRLAEAALKHMTAETITDYHASEAAWREFELASTNPKTILALIAENERLVLRVSELEEGLLNMKMVGDAILSGMAPRQSAAILHGEYFARIDAANNTVA